MSVFELAKKYYPRLWDKSRLDELKAAGKLTQSQYKSLTAAKAPEERGE